MGDKKEKPHHKAHHSDPREQRWPGWKRVHKDWRLWLIVGMMLLAMLTYVMTMDESVTPGGNLQPIVPVAPAS